MHGIRILILGLVAIGLFGCGQNEELIEVKGIDPMTQVQSTLQNYAKGQPLASETTSYDYMVTEVRKVDPAKADILKSGLDDLKKTKGAATKAKAKELLKKLGLQEA